MKTALEFTSYMDKEKDYVPWASGLRNLGYIGSMFSMKPVYSDYEVILANYISDPFACVFPLVYSYLIHYQNILLHTKRKLS